MGALLSIADLLGSYPFPAQLTASSALVAHALFNYIVQESGKKEHRNKHFISFLRYCKQSPKLAKVRKNILGIYAVSFTVDLIGSFWWRYSVLRAYQKIQLAKALNNDNPTLNASSNRGFGIQGPEVLAIDLDQTLLDRNGKITPKTIDLLGRFKARGTSVVLATARGHREAMAIAEMVEPNFLVCGNGSTIIWGPSGVVWDQQQLDITTIQRILKQVQCLKTVDYIAMNFDAHWDTNDLAVFDEVDRYMKGMGKKMKAVARQIPRFNDTYFGSLRQTPVGIYLWSKTESTHELHDKLKKMLDADHKEHNSCVGVIEAGLEGAVMIVRRDVSKIQAIEKICASIGSELSKVLAFGDNENDIGMVKGAGWGVAMCNGLDSLKSIANEVSEFSNNDEGVARILEEILQGTSREMALQNNLERAHRETLLLENRRLALKDENEFLKTSLSAHEAYVDLVTKSSPNKMVLDQPMTRSLNHLSPQKLKFTVYDSTT